VKSARLATYKLLLERISDHVLWPYILAMGTDLLPRIGYGAENIKGELVSQSLAHGARQ